MLTLPESFQWGLPAALALLIPWLALPWLAARLARRRWQDALQFSMTAAMSAAQSLANRTTPGRRLLTPLLCWLALGALILASAQPQAMIRVAERAVDMMIALDTSLSMGADDIRPTRLQAAQDAARRFLSALPPQIRVGLTLFSGNSRVVSAPTRDHARLSDLIAGLSLENLRPGTAIGDAIEASLQAFSPPTAAPSLDGPPRRLILLISDGEQQSGYPWPDAAQDAARQNVVICAIGVGSAQGASIRYQDQTFFVSLNDAALQELAQRTGGRYFRAFRPEDFESIYRALGEQSLETALRPVELSPWLAALALALLTAYLTANAFWLRRVP